MKYGNRPRWKQIVGSPVSLLLFAIILVVIARSAWSIHEKSVFTAAKLEQAQAELAKLQARNADLSQQISYLSTDDGVQAELRSKYHAIQPGESVAVVVDDQQTADVSDASSTPVVSASWWSRLLHMFGL